MPAVPRPVRLLGAAVGVGLSAVAGPYADARGSRATDLAYPRLRAAPPAHVVPRAPKRAPRRGATRVVTIVARDYAFEAPDTVAAGRTELQLVNRGTELHHASLWRLDAGHTAAAFFTALRAGGPPPAWAHDAGGPNSPAPGATSVAVVGLRPGAYALVCVIPSPDGTPHLMKGMARALTVVPAGTMPAAAGGPAPIVTGAPDVTVTLTDYAFGLSRPLTRGRHVVRVRNAAAQSHEVFVGRLAPGKTARDVVAWIEQPAGPPPLLPLGGTAGMAHGATNDIALDLAPGEYALFCFVPDATDGRPHVAHGMVKQFTVR